MKLYSYVVKHDTGFSPNPFWGYCTLACCKPAIRRTASVGDWVLGLSPKAEGNKLIYAMPVEEVLTYEEYYADRRFASKIPDYDKGKVVCKCGDNIYRPLPNGEFIQHRSRHSCRQMAHDLEGQNVLISTRFHYFGKDAIDLPGDLHELKVGRGHKCRFSLAIVSRFREFIGKQPSGVNAPPSKWPDDDDSWKTVDP